MAVSLVIMAAGLGSRYGGSKQVDGIGPNGEILMEYSIHDALRAGFDKVVFIIKPEMREMMDELVGYLKEKKTAKGQPVQVAYVYQDYTSVPDFYHIPEGRTKPFGTVHALLCAESAVDGPFCVINADDYYGVDAYRTIYEELVKLPAEGKGTMVGYLLKNTASLHGTVSRGVCKVKDGKLDTIQERRLPYRNHGAHAHRKARRRRGLYGGWRAFHPAVRRYDRLHELLGLHALDLPGAADLF